MTTLSAIQIPTYMADIFKYGISIILIFIVLNIVIKCGCSIYKTIYEIIEWRKMNDDDDDDDDWDNDDIGLDDEEDDDEN